MALARVKTWNAGDTLTAADLNAEYNNILNNPTSLINLSAAGDIAIVSSAAAVTRLAIGTAAQCVSVSTGLLPYWSAPILQSYLSGCQITAITQTSSGTITHSSGVAVDSTSNTVAMVLSSSLIGTTTGAFIAGNNQPKLQVSPLAASTSYHVYVMSSVLGGSVDVLYSSSTSPTLPTGYSKSRRVGSFFTGSTGNILAMQQFGEWFRLSTPILDANNVASTTTYQNFTLTVPTGVTVVAYGNIQTGDNSTGNARRTQMRPPTATDAVPVSAVGNPLGVVSFANNSDNAISNKFFCLTNTSAQVQIAANSTGTVSIATEGWIDTRGRND